MDDTPKDKITAIAEFDAALIKTPTAGTDNYIPDDGRYLRALQQLERQPQQKNLIILVSREQANVAVLQQIATDNGLDFKYANSLSEISIKDSQRTVFLAVDAAMPVGERAVP